MSFTFKDNLGLQLQGIYVHTNTFLEDMGTGNIPCFVQLQNIIIK